MALATRGLVFEDRAEKAPSHPNRMDIACFVGEVAFRAGVAPVERPVAATSWEEFDGWFAWDERPVEGSDEFAVSRLGAAVQSFFREGGRLCYIVRTGDPKPLTLGAPPNQEQRLEALIPGFPAVFAALPADRRSRRGIAHLFGLEDVTILVLPDLPELVAAPPRLRAPRRLSVIREEVFVECSEELAEEAPNTFREIPAPRSDAVGYTRWAAAVSTVVGVLSRYRRDVQLVAAIPLPAQGQRLDDVYHLLQMEMAVLTGTPDEQPNGIASAFAQLCYPWVKTAGSGRMPEGIESPDGSLAGLLARNALTRGAFASACPLLPRGILDVSPDVPREHMLRLYPARPGSRTEHCMADRVSLFGFRPGGMRLLSDATTSLNPGYRPAAVNRLMSLLVRAARIAGSEVVFENSGPIAWQLLESQLRTLGERLFDLGALRGASAEAAFTVRCDRSTMSTNDLDNGRLVAEVSFQAALPVERLRVVLTLESGGRVGLQEAA